MGNKRETYVENWVEYQKCCRCWEFKTLDNFCISNGTPHTVCKSCKAAYDIEYRKRTKEWRAEKSKIYREKNHDKLIQKSREKYKENSKKYIDKSNEYRRRKVKENWFAREWFHEQARKLVKKIWVEFNKCFLCGVEWKTELHHPSYESRAMWSIVVPLCRSCHRYVEKYPDECPHPIDLLLLEKER